MESLEGHSLRKGYLFIYLYFYISKFKNPECFYTFKGTHKETELKIHDDNKELNDQGLKTMSSSFDPWVGKIP